MSNVFDFLRWWKRSCFTVALFRTAYHSSTFRSSPPSGFFLAPSPNLYAVSACLMQIAGGPVTIGKLRSAHLYQVHGQRSDPDGSITGISP